MDEQQLQSNVPLETNNMHSQSAGSKPETSKKKLALVVLMVLLVGAAAFAGAYFLQQSKIDDLSTKLSASEAKVTELEKQTTEASAKTTEANSDSAAKATTEYFEIKQLGVKFKTNPTLKNLYYSIGNEGKTAYFSLTGLKDTDCAAEKVSPMALTRYTTEDLASDPAAAVIKKDSKKIGEYYFFIAGGQAQCSDTEDEAAEVSALKQEISKILPDNLEAISE